MGECHCCERHAEDCDSLTEEPGGWPGECHGCGCCGFCGHDPTYDIYDPSIGDDFRCCEESFWAENPDKAPAWWLTEQEELEKYYDEATS